MVNFDNVIGTKSNKNSLTPKSNKQCIQTKNIFSYYLHIVVYDAIYLPNLQDI